MESALRKAEAQSLTGVAQTIAASLQNREDLLYRSSSAADLGPPNPYDLTPLLLPGAPAPDGYPDDWPDAPTSWRYFTQGPNRLGILSGIHDRMLYLLIEVRDDHLIFDAPDSPPLDRNGFGDRLWLGFEDSDHAERQLFIAASAPGPILARRIDTYEYGRKEAVEDPRISGAWQPYSQGYRVELRIPLAMLGSRLGVLVDDRDRRGGEPVSYGSLNSEDLRARGRLLAASPDLETYLNQFLQPGLRITALTPAGAPLSQVNTVLPPRVDVHRSFLARLYRRMLDRSGENRSIDATAPIRDSEHHLLARLDVTQTTDRWLSLRDRALTTLLNFTLITSLIAVLAMFAFAARLALRLARLRNASESALTRDGLVTRFPETRAPDELGDVARSFATLLGRLDEYTGYLRSLAGKLAHEIRTPLTIVRSSLDNLESETLASTARVYLQRAREGSERLNGILIAMNAATRVEEAIQQSERTRFDLVPVLQSAAAAYRGAFPQRQWSCELPGEAVFVDGAPDLIVQALDKLIDNAVDFSPPGATIVLSLSATKETATIAVANPGPTLPPENLPRLFESLWQSRSEADERPHFGLGLYIVRLIAEFHDGHAAAENLPDGSGVRFTLRLSLHREK